MVFVNWVSVLEHVHGHVGCLAAAAVTHPALVLRKKDRADWAVASAVFFVLSAVAMGTYLYPIYRSRIKQRIFIETPAIGYLFERKEHLAYVATVLTIAGGVFYLLGRRGDARLRMLAQRSFAISALAAWLTFLFGIVVAATRSI